MHNVSKEMEVKEVQEKAYKEREARRAKLALTREQLVESKRQVVGFVANAVVVNIAICSYCNVIVCSY